MISNLDIAKSALIHSCTFPDGEVVPQDVLNHCVSLVLIDGHEDSGRKFDALVARLLEFKKLARVTK